MPLEPASAAAALAPPGADPEHSRFVQRVRRRCAQWLPLLPAGAPDRDAIKALIEAEGDKILSDDTLVEMLTAKGFDIARRTVAKYREAMGIGILMNARGLMELIIINIGLQRGVISKALFATLVIMAVVTTLMASPIFEYLVGRHRPKDAPDLADKPT